MLPWLQGYSAAEDKGVLTYGPCVVFVLVKACVLLLVNQVRLNLTVKIYYTPQQCVCLHTATPCADLCRLQVAFPDPFHHPPPV